MLRTEPQSACGTDSTAGVIIGLAISWALTHFAPAGTGSTGSSVPETDSVLTTGEVYELLQAHGTRLQDTPRAALDCFPGTSSSSNGCAWPGGSGKPQAAFLCDESHACPGGQILPAQQQAKLRDKVPHVGSSKLEEPSLAAQSLLHGQRLPSCGFVFLLPCVAAVPLHEQHSQLFWADRGHMALSRLSCMHPSPHT